MRMHAAAIEFLCSAFGLAENLVVPGSGDQAFRCSFRFGRAFPTSS